MSAEYQTCKKITVSGHVRPVPEGQDIVSEQFRNLIVSPGVCVGGGGGAVCARAVCVWGGGGRVCAVCMHVCCVYARVCVQGRDVLSLTLLPNESARIHTHIQNTFESKSRAAFGSSITQCKHHITGRLPLIRIRYNSNIPCNSNFFVVPIFCKSLQVKIECIIRSTKSAPVG